MIRKKVGVYVLRGKKWVKDFSCLLFGKGVQFGFFGCYKMGDLLNIYPNLLNICSKFATKGSIYSTQAIAI